VGYRRRPRSRLRPSKYVTHLVKFRLFCCIRGCLTCRYGAARRSGTTFLGCLVLETGVSEYGVRGVSVWGGLLGLSDAVVEGVDLDPDRGVIIARVRVRAGMVLRCSRCLARCARYDRGEGRRRWRHLDAGVLKVFVEAEAPRVACRECGVTVAHVPWAHAGTGHTHDFDRQVAWCATHMSKTAVTSLIRIAWRTVGAIVERYWRDVQDCFDQYGDSPGSGSTRSPTRRTTSTSRSWSTTTPAA
jgi:hypothetical protein